jgi:hypothetical protein
MYLSYQLHYLWLFLMYVITFNNSLFMASLLFQLMLHIFQIKWLKWCVINVWAIMHLDTHFLEFELLDYDNVKPLENKIS